MAGIVQRAMNSKQAEGEELLSDEDKEMLFASLNELETKAQETVKESA